MARVLDSSLNHSRVAVEGKSKKRFIQVFAIDSISVRSPIEVAHFCGEISLLLFISLLQSGRSRFRSCQVDFERDASWSTGAIWSLAGAMWMIRKTHQRSMTWLAVP
jgi:hypothetical protein